MLRSHGCSWDTSWLNLPSGWREEGSLLASVQPFCQYRDGKRRKSSVRWARAGRKGPGLSSGPAQTRRAQRRGRTRGGGCFLRLFFPVWVTESAAAALALATGFLCFCWLNPAEWPGTRWTQPHLKAKGGQDKPPESAVACCTPGSFLPFHGLICGD